VVESGEFVAIIGLVRAVWFVALGLVGAVWFVGLTEVLGFIGLVGVVEYQCFLLEYYLNLRALPERLTIPLNWEDNNS